MQLSIIIAQAMALAFLTLGLGLIFSKDYYKSLLRDYYSETSAMYLGGLMALILGFFIVTFHNHWAANWTVLVTLFGWLSLIKGILIIIIPGKIIPVTKLIRNPENLSPMLFLLAAIFGYFGFFAS